MKVRRDVVLFGAVLVAAVGGGWWLLANRPGAAVETFRTEYQRQVEAAKPRLPPADAFRATVCAASPCVVVEAGGLTFIFGAGKDAADGISQLGLMHANIDALLLPDLRVDTVEGLPAIAVAGARAGRREPLKVFGPTSLLPAVDGANLIVSASQQARLVAGVEGEDQSGYGRVVFDSGVVTVRGFGGAERGTGRVYRIDFDARSLILSGCLSLPADIIAAAREAKQPSVILMAGSEKLLGSASACIDLANVVQAIRQARTSLNIIVPSEPAATSPAAAAAWRDILAEFAGVGVAAGLPGTQIDLTGETAHVLQK